MELRQLRHFLALTEHRHFGRAAESLCITQQALSHSINQLEKSIATRLFERGLFGAEQTEAGRLFEVRARRIIAESDIAVREAQALSTGAEGGIRFGVSQTMTGRVLPAAVDRFRRARPKVSLTVRVDLAERLFERVASGDLEFAVTAPAVDLCTEGELQHELFWTHRGFDANFMIMRAAHPLSMLAAPGLTEAARYPWVIPETLKSYSQWLMKLFSAQGVELPPYMLRTDSFAAAHAIVANSDFVALTGAEAAHSDLKAGTLTGFALPGIDLPRPSVVSSRAHAPLQAATQALVGIFRELLRRGDAPQAAPTG